MCVRVERNEEKEEQKLYACTHTHTRACALLFVGERRPSGRERWAAGCESAAAAAARGVAGRPRRCPQAAQAAARRSRPSACVSKLPPRHFGSAVACTHACHLHTRKSAFTQTDRQTNKQTDTRTQTHRHTDTQTNKQTNNQTNARLFGLSGVGLPTKSSFKSVGYAAAFASRTSAPSSPRNAFGFMSASSDSSRATSRVSSYAQCVTARGQEREVKRERSRERERG